MHELPFDLLRALTPGPLLALIHRSRGRSNSFGCRGITGLIDFVQETFAGDPFRLSQAHHKYHLTMTAFPDCELSGVFKLAPDRQFPLPSTRCKITEFI